MRKLTAFFAAASMICSAAARELPPTRPIIPEIEAPSPMGLPWTLRQCIDHARENNIQVLRQGLSVEDARIAKQQSRLNYIPSLSGSASSDTSFGRILDQTTYEYRENATNTDLNGSVSLSTDLFAGLEKYHSLKRSDLGLQAALLDIEKLRNDLELNVAAAYLDILYAQEQIAITETQMETLSSQVNQTKALVEGGRNTISDLLQLQSQLSEAQYQNITATNQLETAYFTLCQLLEIEDHRYFRVYTPAELAIPDDRIRPDTAAILEDALSLPQIGAAKTRLGIAERDVSIAKASLYPSLRLSASYGSAYSDGRQKMIMDATDPAGFVYARYPFQDQIRDNANGYVSLSLSIPIFNSMKARNNVRLNKIALQRAHYDLALVHKELNKDIQQATIDANGAFEQYHAAVKNVETNEESFRMVEQKFQLGAAVAVDYNIAIYNLSNARSQLARAKYEYIFKTKILDFYRGTPINL